MMVSKLVIPLTAFWYLSDPAFRATSSLVMGFLFWGEVWAWSLLIRTGSKLRESGLLPVGKLVVGYLFPSYWGAWISVTVENSLRTASSLFAS